MAGYLRGGGIVVPLVTALLAFLVGGIVVLLSGSDPLETYKAIFNGTGLNWLFPWISSEDRTIAAQNLQQTLLLTTPLILTGLAVAYAFRAGLFNIGGQGQYIVGGIAAGWGGSSFGGMPHPLPVILAILAAAGGGALGGGGAGWGEGAPRAHGGVSADMLNWVAVGGALWGGIAGWLKAATGAHEVISTIMLNWVAIWVGVWLFGLGGPLQNDKQRSIPVSNDIAAGAKLPVFWGEAALQGLHVGLFIAVGMLVVFW